jgi:hypothetical protein
MKIMKYELCQFLIYAARVLGMEFGLVKPIIMHVRGNRELRPFERERPQLARGCRSSAAHLAQFYLPETRDATVLLLPHYKRKFFVIICV